MDSGQVNKVDGLKLTFSEAKNDLTTSHLSCKRWTPDHPLLGHFLL